MTGLTTLLCPVLGVALVVCRFVLALQFCLGLKGSEILSLAHKFLFIEAMIYERKSDGPPPTVLPAVGLRKSLAQYLRAGELSSVP